MKSTRLFSMEASKAKKIPGLPSHLNLVSYSDSEEEQDERVEEQMDVEQAEISDQDFIKTLLNDIVDKAIASDVAHQHRGHKPASDGYFSVDSDSDSDESTSSSSNSSSSSDDSSSDEEDQELKKLEILAEEKKAPRTKGEIIDLPPIEDLCISVPQEECVQIGEIASIVEDQVVVKAFPNTPACDLDSIFFLELGQFTRATSRYTALGYLSEGGSFFGLGTGGGGGWTLVLSFQWRHPPGAGGKN